MKVIDSFCFPLLSRNEQSLLDEPPVDLESLQVSSALKRYFCLFGRDISACEHFLTEVSQTPKAGALGLIPSELSPNDPWWDYQSQFSGFVLHPYLQDLSELQGLQQCISAGIIAGRPVFVSTAIGSQKMYRIFPLKVADAVAQLLSSPVVLAHAGGAKVLEALLIADANPHVYLETSFSLHYWQGSSVENDLAFAVKKLGSHRCLYGSDAPFCSEHEALEAHVNFFDKHNFSDSCVNNIMHQNAQQLMG